MQYTPQYNAENSVTNRLVKQLKKAKAVSNVFLTNAHRHQQWQQLERVPKMLGAEESPRRDTHVEHGRISQNPSTDR